MLTAQQNQWIFYEKMDRGYEKEKFEGLKIKASIAQKFRRYSRSISESQSMTLLLMMEFFEDNEVSPHDRLGETISSLKSQIKKRFNAVVAIIKNIEKTHHKPTTAILQTLFQEVSAVEKEEEEEFSFETPQLSTENEELTYYRNAYFSIQQNYNGLKYDMEEVIEKTTYVKNSFGNGHLKLEMTKAEFENLKQKLQDVHHYNQTGNSR